MAHEIKSPIPGTFYRRPSPDDPPFKEIGDAVAAGDVIGLVEVMKTFYEIKAEQGGTITAISVEDGAIISAGQTVMEMG